MVTMDSKHRNKIPLWLFFVPHEGPLDECLALGGRPSLKQEVKLQGSLSHRTLSVAYLSKTNKARRKDTRSFAVETTGKGTFFFLDLLYVLALLCPPPPCNCKAALY